MTKAGLIGRVALVGALGFIAVGGATGYRRWHTLTAKLPVAPLPPRSLPLRPRSALYAPFGPVDTAFFAAKHNQPIVSIAVSHDDTIVVSASSDTVILSDRATGQPLRSLGVAGVASVALTSDDSAIVTGGDARLRVFATATGAEAWSLPLDRVTSVVITKDDRTAYAASWDETIHVIDLAAHRERGTYQLEQPITALAIAPDEKRLAAGCLDGSVTILAPAAVGFRIIARFRPHELAVHSLAYAPDGALLASGADDNRTVLSELQPKPSVVAEFPAPKPVPGVAFSPDGKLLAAARADGELEAIAVASRWLVTARDGDAFTAVQFTHDGRTLLAGSGPFLARLVVPKRGFGTVLPATPTGAPTERAPRDADEAAYLAAMRSVIEFPDHPLLSASESTPLQLLAKARAAVARACARPKECDRAEIASVAAPALAAADALSAHIEWLNANAAIEAAFGNVQKAEISLSAASARAPRNPDTVLIEAGLLIDQRRFGDAIASLSALVEATSQREVLVAAWRALALAYAGTGDIDAAEGAYRERLALANQKNPAREALATFYLSINEPDKATAVSDMPQAKIALADELLWTQHRPDDALAIYDSAGGVPWASFGRAAVFRQRGDLVRAQTTLFAALSQWNDPTMHPPDDDDAKGAIERALSELPAP